MAVNSVLYARSLTLDTDRGPSEAIWGSCPFVEIKSSRKRGLAFEDDFEEMGTAPASGGALAGSAGRWSTYMYQGGQINDAQKEGGVIKLSSDGDNEGVALLGQAGAYRFVTTSTLALNPKMWFE